MRGPGMFGPLPRERKVAVSRESRSRFPEGRVECADCGFEGPTTRIAE
jgi:predicted RNA-binding Zn-ribbon protein involved in translation (DUF1610 family)